MVSSASKIQPKFVDGVVSQPCTSLANPAEFQTYVPGAAVADGDAANGPPLGLGGMVLGVAQAT